VHLARQALQGAWATQASRVPHGGFVTPLSASPSAKLWAAAEGTTGDGSCSLMVVLTGIILAALRYLPPQ
jgi:hypothetical protein